MMTLQLSVREMVEDGDIVCVTEAVVAHSQKRYSTCDELAQVVKATFNLRPKGALAVVYPIASRNRFAGVLPRPPREERS